MHVTGNIGDKKRFSLRGKKLELQFIFFTLDRSGAITKFT
jgi:hypothetical protein